MNASTFRTGKSARSILLPALGLGLPLTLFAAPLAIRGIDSAPLKVSTVDLRREGKELWVSGSLSGVPGYWGTPDPRPNSHVHVRILDSRGKILAEDIDRIGTIYRLSVPPTKGGASAVEYVARFDALPPGAAEVEVISHTDGHTHPAAR
ncbi:MAG: hypothetical protein PW734_11200 [Verrucomicrobium sp.]|nr:hypothetical protein [Verrucomicrobium sp.]